MDHNWKKMDSQIPPTRDRANTSRTLVMERYFIDLMLDQMHRGNRLGHTFNKQSWTDILAMFNSKFRTKYDQDILRSHYTALWKQYNDVKNLLKQSEFSWDDTQKMVVAADEVWDAYMKAHPDSECYKTKSLVNFNDLCLMFAYTEADGRYSRSSHDVDFDDDIQGLIIGIHPASIEHVRTDWTPDMDRCLVERMLDEVRKGNKTDKSFSNVAWNDILSSLNVRFCSKYGKKFLMRRYNKLFKYYSDMRRILKRNGFSWDEKHQMILADDGIWEKYIKGHPEAHSYRGKPLLNYEHLILIYSNEITRGHHEAQHQNQITENKCLQIETDEEKDCHYSAGSHGPGPIWNPLMDYYLIDLLQDQTLRGNKIGYEYTSKAWTEMTKLFNAKVGLTCEKNILRNRFKHLRRQYNDAKVILEQTGFSWDENREMIIAEDHVWDSYIKMHPDAQPYRNKSVPSYHKLCLIYGEEGSFERCRQREHNVDLGSESPDMIIGKHDDCHADGDLSETSWTPVMDRYFVDLMLEQIHRGNKIDYTTDSQAWIDMAVLFKERFGSQYDKDILKSRCRSFQKLHSVVKSSLERRRFSWDGTLQFIMEQPEVELYGTRFMEDYNDLFLIYGKPSPDDEANLLGPGQFFNNNYYGKTNWTPAMDRYFIDLLLEHVRQGSMGKNLTRQEWSCMSTKISSEFGYQHDENILRSHFMNLMKQFSDMKSLLDHSGFAWDELRQKIIADDSLWHAYLKDCPDARSYWNRTLPNYNDLFLIFGGGNINGMDNDSSRSRAICDCVLVPSDDEEDSPVPPVFNPLPINWTKSMEVYFIQLMLGQVIEGNVIGKTFTEQAWAWIIESFNEKFGVLCDKNEVESLYLSLMKEYNNIRMLINQIGFAWDGIQQKVIADDDNWEVYIKRHPGAIKYRNRMLGSYNDLCVIFGNRVVGGRLSRSSIEMENNNGVLGSVSTGALTQNKRNCATSSIYSMSSRKVQKLNEEAEEALGTNFHVARNVRNKDDGEHLSIEVIVDALQAIPGMDDELFLEACQILENEEKAKLFVKMDATKRRKWLSRKLNW
ncbi:hypothetical protein K2173_027212 [Erythroxylum novogranatense]|uniref:L10-interacting MYB domain-containing protein n=1 Tax=Erythroxylum novogranatense TaxID=1862640 RepID=A0AAV8U1W5_9ROSI|nr:hypothetical protein K2173_027212 [Erythroxylum novogranatense]